jgi:hypothetical protein
MIEADNLDCRKKSLASQAHSSNTERLFIQTNLKQNQKPVCSIFI